MATIDAPADHPFDQAIRLEALSDGAWRGHTSDSYWNFVGPYGGVTAATMLNAILRHPQRLGDPLSFTVNFTAPVARGEFRVETRLVRAGRSTQHWSIAMLQGEARETVTSAIAVFALRRPVWSIPEAGRPEVPAPDACLRFPGRPEMKWPARYEIHYVDWRFGKENPDSLSRSWVRDEPARDFDFASLTAACDSFAPRIFMRRPSFVPIGTVSLNIYYHVGAQALSRQGTAPVLGSAQAQVFNEGFFDQQAQLWGKDGALLATTQQIVWYKE